MSAPQNVHVNPAYLGTYLAARFSVGPRTIHRFRDLPGGERSAFIPTQNGGRFPGRFSRSSGARGWVRFADGAPPAPCDDFGGRCLARGPGRRRPRPSRREPPAAEALEADQVRASQWIEATTRELVRIWDGSGADGADVDSPARSDRLSDEHRYEIARLLVDLLREHPDGPMRIEPTRLAGYLTAPETVHRAVSTDSGQRWAEARALARVLVVALRCDFQRELTTVLGEAWTAIAETAERQADQLDQALALTPEARRIAWQRLLDIGGVLYAATLARVHRDSVRMIQAYQDCLNAGDAAGADWLARAYQDRRLGYAGIPHYFQIAVQPIDRWVQAALAAVNALAVREAPKPPLDGSTRGARRRTAPAAPGGGGNEP